MKNFLATALRERETKHALRQLKKKTPGLVDFSSNDYLGIVTNKLIAGPNRNDVHGSTGSRLLTGNYTLIEEAEKEIAKFHNSESGLIFNSGYDANLGLLACIATKEDVIIFDKLAHASIRDGIRLSFAQSYSFIHNDLGDLQKKLEHSSGAREKFVVTESVFSMDGDLAPLKDIAFLCQQFNAHLIVDEAHATGLFGERGEGVVQQLGLEEECFARVHTFSKALGAHGAIVVGSNELKDYLVNFARSFIYSTALPPAAIHSVIESYNTFPGMVSERRQLWKLKEIFAKAGLPFKKIESNSPIQAVIVEGNIGAKKVAFDLQYAGFDVRPILYPTVPIGQERLRIVLHAFNNEKELLNLLTAFSKINLLTDTPA